MQYYRTDSTTSRIEALLDRVAATQDGASSELKSAAPNTSTDSTDSFLNPPTLEQFLEEEDILRECRGDNKRLIAYLCQPDIVRALVAFSITSTPESMTSRSTPATPTSSAPNGEDKSDDSDVVERSAPAAPSDPSETNASTVDDAPPNTEDETSAEDLSALSNDSATAPQMNPMKYPYVASELLSADIRELCDVVVEDDSVMDLIFACVENNEPGHLDPFVASHFSKVIVSLLKTRNAQTLKQMKRRSQAFTDSLIKHIALGPISELIVRLLDAPEHERSYDHTIHPPTPGAISLLSSADLLNKLSESFVRASNALSESESPIERRHREETLANVTATITGLTERILQLPPLNVPIPEELSPYHTPKAISRLLDAGLSVVTTTTKPEKTGKKDSSPTAVTTQASSVVLSGNYSALLHSLGLAANLMTTKGNIWEEDKPQYDPHNSDSTADGDEGVMEGTDNTLSAFGEEPQPVVSDLIRPRIPGENIVSTSLLEQELVLRFERLAEMFGSLESDDSSKLPLGSLRLKLAEFFTACMKKASRATVERSIELGVPKKLLELFRRYEWSSMLHGVVTASIISALEAGMSGLPARIAWFQAQLVPWLLSAWSTNEQKEAKEECRFRAGYMGHLIKIGAALRIYICETESMNKEALLQLVSEENLEKFKKFSEDSLGPAHQIEVTPLCDNDSESEEVYEEDTVDLLDAGVGEVIEGLTQGDPGVAIQRFSKFLLHKSGGNIEFKDEEEDIQTVDVGDLSHFPDDDVDVQEVNVDIDHDLPPEMRDQLRGESSAASSSSQEKRLEKMGASGANGIATTVDADDEDGTYESHIAKKASTSTTTSTAAAVDRLSSDFKESVRIVEPLSIGDAEAHDVVVPIPSPSLEVDAAVTEIDEPQPVTPNVTPLQPRTGTEAPDDSSDEDELGEWVEFSEFDKQQQQQQQQGAALAASISSATPKVNVADSIPTPAVVKVKDEDSVVAVTKSEVARPTPAEPATGNS